MLEHSLYLRILLGKLRVWRDIWDYDNEALYLYFRYDMIYNDNIYLDIIIYIYIY